MASIRYIYMLFSITLWFSLGYSNVIRLDKAMNTILRSDEDAEKDNVFEDNIVIGFNRNIDLDEGPKLQLKDTKLHHLGSVHQHNRITSVHHFARHVLCRNIDGKVRFYTALKSKLCRTKREFIAQLVDDLCYDKGRQLDNWVAELFDLNGDGDVNHFEKMFYDD